MPLFPYREEAEAFLATITRHPDWKYEVLPNGCGSGYSVEVRDAEGILIVEAYDGESQVAAVLAERKHRTDEARRRGGKFQ